MKAVVIAGTHSGVGKTAVALGIMAAARRRGYRVRPFKVGPDFIDPGHHGAVAGAPSRNLDGWMLTRAYNRATFLRHAGLTEGDFAVVEGAMGLFDGLDGRGPAASTAEMARWLGLPVVLVVDASAMARSVAALVQGFKRFDKRLNVAGVVLNRVGGPGHLRYLADALEGMGGLRLLGGLPASEALAIPERHLGLATVDDYRLGPRRVAAIASLVEDRLDLGALLEIADVRPPQGSASSGPGRRLRSSARGEVRLGVARDEAFCFYYADNLDLLEASGADLVFFSPIRDRRLPEGVRGLYFGGGYPELWAAQLSANGAMLKAVRRFVEGGGLVYAECGGLMYLSRGVRAAGRRFFPMVGVYPVVARMLPALRALGYVEAEVAAPPPLGFRGRVRGHEFHYSEMERAGGLPARCELVYRLRESRGEAVRREGYLYKRALASYVHFHFGSNPAFARALVRAAERV